MSLRGPGLFRYWLDVFGWMAVIFLLSSIPGDELPGVGIPNIDKLVHLAEYLILGGLLMKAFSHSSSDIALKRIMILSLAVAAIYACLDELHQYFVSDRTPDLIDFIFDLLGSLAGIFLPR